MSRELERRWDDAVESAWREFRQRLADRLAELAEDETLIAELSNDEEGGAAPYCQAIAGARWLRVEAVSNVYLADVYELDDRQHEALVALGFEAPSYDNPQDNAEQSSNFWVDLEQREADRAAVMVVRALREVYAVLHPSYLEPGEGEGTADIVTPRVLPPKPRPEQPVTPDGPDELRRAVDLAVRDLLPYKPEWDADGDLVMHTEHGLVWVSVSEVSARILIHSPLVDEVVDESRALVEVNLLNDREFGLTFSFRDGRIRVTRDLDATVLVPAQLRLEVERFVNQVDRWACDLVTRVGGQRMDDQTTRQPASARADRPAGGRFATAYAVMVELEREQRGSVGPATMARIFENDTGLLLKAVRINEQRRREMRVKARAARDQGRSRAEQVARARQEYLRELTGRMRAALRLIVDAPVRKVQLDQLSLFDEDECGTGR
jgi:hypothetical protein